MASKNDVSNPEDPNRDSIKDKNNELIDESEDKGKNKEKDDSFIKDSINKEGKNSHDEVIPKNIPKRKYIPKNEQEALKAKIIKLEMNEKNNDYMNYDFNIHNNIDNLETQGNEKFKVPPELKKNFYCNNDISSIGNSFDYLWMYKSYFRCNAWRRNNVLGIRKCCYYTRWILFLSIL